MTEIWMLEIIENPTENRDAILDAIIVLLDKHGIPTHVRAIFNVSNDQVKLYMGRKE
jgi:hypothetical protein